MMQVSGRFLVLLVKIITCTTLGAADRVGAEDKDDDDGRNDLEYDTDSGDEEERRQGVKQFL